MRPPGTPRCRAARPGSGSLLALVLTGLVATFLGAVTLRLGGHFLPLSTIAWGIAIYFVFGNLDALDRYSGLSGIPPISLGPISLAGTAGDLLLHLDRARPRDAALPATCSTRGRAARSAACAAASPWWRASPSTASACGLRCSCWPGCSPACPAGSIAHMQRFVNPTPFDIRPGIEFLFMALRRRRRPDRRRGGRRRHRGAAEERAAGRPAADHPLQRAARDRAVRHPVHRPAAEGARRRGADDPALPAAAAPGCAGRGAAAARRARPAVTGEPLLRIEGATKRFGALAAVNEVSFEVRPGEVLGLIGPNGAGKTTLLNLITGTAKPNSGKIVFLGDDVTPLPPRQIAAKGMARTFQHVKLRPNMTPDRQRRCSAPIRARTSGFLAGAFRFDRAEERSARLRGDGAVAARRPRRRNSANWPAICRSASSGSSKWRARSPPTRWW